MESGPYVEPMTGGGSIAQKVAEMYPKKQIILNDLDQDVACFWQVVSGSLGQDAFASLCEKVEASRIPTDDPVQRFAYWWSVRKMDVAVADPIDRAFRFQFLSKTCFGGQIDASPIGGLNQDGWSGGTGRGAGRKVVCQWWVDNILKQLRACNLLFRGHTEVYSVDGVDLVNRVGPCTAYFDPPYFPGKSNPLYRKEMTAEQHASMAEFLRATSSRWLLSYDDSPAVNELYSWAWVVPIKVKYSHAPGPKEGAKKWASTQELLIARNEIHPV